MKGNAPVDVVDKGGARSYRPLIPRLLNIFHAENHYVPSGTGYAASLTKGSLFATVVVLLLSCSALTEKERAERDYERDNELILAKEEFMARKAACVKHGGVMHITSYGSSRFRKYTAHEFKLAQCVAL